MKRKLLLVFMSVGLLALVASSAQAAPIVISSVQDLHGTWLYEYSVSNPLGSDEDIYDFGVDFIGEATNIVTPAGWDHFYGLGTDTVPSFIDWLSLSPASDLTPGFTLAGFSFESALGPGDIVYHIATTARPIDGTTTGPGAVPEPGTLLLLGTGLTTLVARRRRARRQA
jgi:hypothetical protein